MLLSGTVFLTLILLAILTDSRYLLYLPLNFIPIVGTALFIILQGKRNGPQAHQRYFQLKEWNKGQKEVFVEQNRGGYTA